MISLHSNILEKDGNKEFVVLPYDEFLEIQEELADYEDLRLLRNAKQSESDAATISLEEMKKKLNCD
ncbi:type II toxin-antitoxin system Phd/YefM family antitoxin [bacterium]|nr:type II toxin-antitoxin system Phd/YefM family antitoxin [bacterium]